MDEFKFLRKKELYEVRVLFANIRNSLLNHYRKRLITVRDLREILKENGIVLTEATIRTWLQRNFIKSRGNRLKKNRRIWLTVPAVIRFLDDLERKAEKINKARDIEKNRRESKTSKRPSFDFSIGGS